MTRVLNKIFSMPLMALFLLAFFIAIAVATFVENDFGIAVSQKLYYKAKWFEFIIAYLFVTLIYNIFRYKLFQLKKFGSLIFHVAFLIIVIGAWITRVIGFEGAMLIREGSSSNIIISSETYLQIKVHDLEQQYVYDKPLILANHTNNHFEHSFNFPGETEDISIEFVKLIEGAKDTIIQQDESKGDPYIEIVTVGENGRQYNYLKSGDVLADQGIKIAFNNTEFTDAVSIMETDSGIYVKTPYELTYLQMSDQSEGVVVRDSLQEFMTKRLYDLSGINFVFNAYYPSASVKMIESVKVDESVKAVTVLASQGSVSKEVVLFGGKGMYPRKEKFELGGLHYELGFGSKIVELPFYIYLDNFELERYPGTDNPSSYSSWVTLVDPEKDIEKKHHIFMNNVLDYGGYRFFQSNYDRDEKGTILSVNQDAIGTNVTYFGYFLLALGFVFSLFSRGGRFRLLLKKSTSVRDKRVNLKSLILLIGLTAGGSLFAVDNNNVANETAADSDLFNDVKKDTAVNFEHAEKYGHLVIQNQKGRFEPVHTLANNVLKKVSRSDTYNGQSAMQVWIGLHTNSLAWNLEPFIYVSGNPLREKLNLDSKYASFVDFFTPEFEYVLQADSETARLKKPSERSQYDKDVLKTDERVSVLFGVFRGAYLKIIPLPNDPAQNWYSPFDSNHPFVDDDAVFMNSIIPLYNSAVTKGYQTGDWSQADQVVGLIDVFQRKVADSETIPTKSRINLEITYNNLDIFNKLTSGFLLIGFIILLLEFLQLFIPKLKLKLLHKIGFYIFLIMVIILGSGLIMRWYLSGHAPWSDGYEAVVFIAFITTVLGVSLVKFSRIILGAAGILAWLMLFVAHMSALDPEITNLAPVLKSFWLKIHVAIITGSYAFLGLAAILGLLILIMNLFMNENNKKRILLTTKELTYLSEMVIMIGLFMLTIGTFLGGVWANESWGRYWGWDPKETWALASVIIYAMILHFRFIPFLKSQFAFNVASLWGYASIIMTFFGVNFYLSGLHSYAQGDPVPIPVWVPITVTVLVLLTIASGIVITRIKKADRKKKALSGL